MHLLMMTPLLPAADLAIHSMIQTGNSTLLLSLANVRMSAFQVRIPPTIMVLDIAYPYGTPILAVEAGTVIKAGYHVSYGNYLVINHGGGYCTLYAHCSQLLVQAGNIVNKYDTIAKVGSTGDSTGNHLHICVIVDGVYVNQKDI